MAETTFSLERPQNSVHPDNTSEMQRRGVAEHIQQGEKMGHHALILRWIRDFFGTSPVNQIPLFTVRIGIRALGIYKTPPH